MPPAEELLNFLAQRQPKFTLLSGPSSEHAEQLITGLRLLASAGVLRLETVPSEPTDWDCPAPRLSRNRSLIRAIVEDVPVVYDLDDSTALSGPGVAWSEAYFKRMLLPDDTTTKIRPYGLNYPVAPDVPPNVPVDWRDVPANDALMPREDAGNGVLHLTRLWDPSDARSEADRLWRERINTFRMDVHLALLDELGGLVTGGVVEDTYSSRVCPRSLIAVDSLTRKESYLRLASGAAVIVTTLGLHESIGWRFGEAVALGRAAVTERSRCLVPGSWSEGVQYLAFGTPGEASSLTRRLIESPDRLARLQSRAREYFEEWLRPDVLVARTVASAIWPQERPSRSVTPPKGPDVI